MTLQRIGGRIISFAYRQNIKIFTKFCRDRRLNVCEANFTLNEVKQHDRSVQNAMIFYKRREGRPLPYRH